QNDKPAEASKDTQSSNIAKNQKETTKEGITSDSVTRLSSENLKKTVANSEPETQTLKIQPERGVLKIFDSTDFKKPEVEIFFSFFFFLFSFFFFLFSFFFFFKINKIKKNKKKFFP